MSISTPVIPPVAGASSHPVLCGWSGKHSDAYPVVLFEPVTLPNFTPVAVSVSQASSSPVGFAVVTRDPLGVTTTVFTGSFPAGSLHESAATLDMGVFALTVGHDIAVVLDGIAPADGAGLIAHFDATA